MDDANVPSLLSLPYLGFLAKDDPAYLATKQVVLSRANPYFAAGANFSGVGGPHVDAWHPWPMSQISAVFGTDDDDEIVKRLYLIANVRLPSYIYPSVPPKFRLAHLLFSTEHERFGPHTRVAIDLHCLGLDAAVVCVGEQLLCGDDAGSCAAQAVPHL